MGSLCPISVAFAIEQRNCGVELSVETMSLSDQRFDGLLAANAIHKLRESKNFGSLHGDQGMNHISPQPSWAGLSLRPHRSASHLANMPAARQLAVEVRWLNPKAIESKRSECESAGCRQWDKQPQASSNPTDVIDDIGRDRTSRNLPESSRRTTRTHRFWTMDNSHQSPFGDARALLQFCQKRIRNNPPLSMTSLG